MAQGWNPYLHNYVSLPSDHGTPDAEVGHPLPADDFISHGGFSSASISHGPPAANTNYCFSNSIGSSSSNWSSEIGNSQRSYREMAWQPDGEQKAYLPTWDNSVSNFEGNVLETAGHCSIAPQLGLKHESVAPKGSQYLDNYLNIQGSSAEVSEPRSCDFMTSSSEHNPQTGTTARYHPQWHQRHTEKSNMSADRAYSNMWPNLAAENATKCVQEKSKSFEHHGITFVNSNTYADSGTQKTGDFDRTNKQETFVNICQNVNLTEHYNGIDSQTMMDTKDTVDKNKDKKLDSAAHKASTDNQATNIQTSDSFLNEKDDGPSQSSSQSSVTNDFMNSDVSLTDNSEASNDSQSSLQSKAVNADEKFVATADCSAYSHSSPTACDDGHSDMFPESHMDSLTDTVREEQVAPSKEEVAVFSSLSISDPSTVNAGDMKDEHDELTESNASCNDGFSVSTIDNKTNESDSAAKATIDDKINESDPFDSAAKATIDDKINESEPFDSAAKATIDDKINESELFDSAPNVTIDSKTNTSDSLDSAANATIDSKTNESDPLDSVANSTINKPSEGNGNVSHNKDEGDHDTKTFELQRPCPEEKVLDSDYMVDSSDAIIDGDESNKAMVVFDSEPKQVEDCLNKQETTTTWTTSNVACDDRINDKSIENELNALSNFDIMNNEPFLKCPEEKSSPEKKIYQESPENSQIPSDTTPSMKRVQNAVENVPRLESEIPEDQSLAYENSNPKYSNEEHLEWDDFGKPLTPSSSEMDERPESPEMKPSSDMSKKLQPIVLINTSDLVHLISDKYICAQCMHITSSVDDLIEHHSLQHPMRSFQLCTSCGDYLVYQDQSRKHLCGQESITVSLKTGKRRKRQKQYCNKCGIRFVKWNSFISHMRVHTGVTPYRCEKCKLYFAQQSTLTRHRMVTGRCRGSLPIAKRAPQKSYNRSVKSMFKCYVKLYDITKTHFCKYCGKCFGSPVKVNKHYHNVHKKHTTIPKQSKETSEITEENKKYKCLLCPMTFNDHLNRNRHLKDCLKANVFGKKNRVNGRYKCPLCLASFTLTSNRHRHMHTFCLRNFLSFLRKDTSKPIKFPRYSKDMKTVITKLKAEENKLNGQSVNVKYTKDEPRFKCNTCPQVFSNKFAKYRHSKKHKVSEVTGRRIKSSHLNSVTDTNEIQKKDIDSLKCTFCDKSFGSSKALKIHEFTHQGETPYYCSQCGKGFKSRFVLTHHKITHQRRIQCTVCRKILPTIGELIQHRTTHINRGMLQCPDCPRQFTFPVYLVRHLRYHLKNQNRILQLDQPVKKNDSSSLTQYQCQLCSEEFGDSSTLRKHYLTHIPKSSSPQCPFCKRKFTNRRYLLRHMSRHFGGKRLSKESNFESHSKSCSSETETKGSFVCRYCSRTFIHKGHLVKHYRGHKNKTLSRCEKCTFYFGISKLCKHKKMCNSEVIDSTSKKTNLPSVRKNPSEEMKYRCPHCPKTFRYLSLYNRHFSTHKDVEIHACILCGQTFPSLELCSQHEASCDGLYKCEESTIKKKAEVITQGSTREFKCKFCNKKFSKSRNLRLHILTHNEVKPYRCKACGMCFSRYDHLKVHTGRCVGKEKLHLKPEICIPKISLDQVGTGWQKVVKKQIIECKICVRTFSAQSKLNWHNSMFHSVKRFKCMQCSSFFIHEKSLRNHIRYRRCRLTNIVKSKTRLQTTQTTTNFEKHNVLLARILPTSTEQNGSKTIKCNFCLRTFRTTAHLKVHMSLHCEKSFSCDCGKRFFKKPHLLRHMTTCVKKQNQSSPHGFSCAYCSSRFLLFSQLQEHFLNAHQPETMDEPLETAPLQQHLSNIQHFEENQSDKSESYQTSKLNRALDGKKSQTDSQMRECPYPCKICNKGYWNKTLLRNHFRKCCRNVSNTTPPLEEDVPLRADIDMVLTDSEAENTTEEMEDTEPQNKSSQEKKPAVYQCSECDKSFTDGLLLISHLEDHGREEQEKKLNKCSKCGKTFLNQARLEKHMMIHETVRFICKSCSTELPSQTELETHRKKHHNPSNPYCCRLCLYRFRTRINLSDHCTEKHPEDIFSCNLCNRNYTLRTSLIRHNRKHHRQEQKESAEKSLSTQSSSESEAAAVHGANDDADAGGGGDDGGDDDDDDDDYDDVDGEDDDDDNSDSADSDSAPYFPCHVCGKTFTTSESLEDHQRCHLGEKPYECAQCGQCFFLAGQLQQHERKHKSEFQCRVCGRGFVSLFALRKHKHTSGKKRPFRCTKCPLYFTSSEGLAEHRLSHREESFPCDICNRVFPSKISRAEHRKIHMPKSSATSVPDQPAVKADNKPASLSTAATNEFKYRCGVCCVRFRNPEELSEHGCLAGIERQYSCLDCDKHFLHSSHLKKHLSTHKQPSSQSKYSCNQCNNSFSSPQDFLNHLRNHDETIRYGHGFVCPVCHQCFPSPAELVFHFPNHPSGTFQCKNCNKTFSTATQLKEHEICHAKETKCKKCGQSVQGTNHECSQRHIELMNIVSSFADDDEIDVTGEDLCFCPFCPMQFSSRSNLLEHQNREHPNEKSYTCEICARTYAKQKYLDRHMKKHQQNDTDQSTSQSKFQCAQCHSEFNTATDLSIHLKLHDAEKEVGEYRCDMCYKSFGQLQLLRRHQESHVGQVVYECTECDKAFAFPHLLEEHQKSHV